MFSSSQLVVPLLCLIISHCTIASKWSQHKVVGDVIDKEPVEILKVVYNEFDKKADLGNVLTPTQVRKQPAITWAEEKGAYYTLVMVDPDAPSRKNPVKGQWRHWLVGNVMHNDISNGDILSDYVGAGPPPNTDLHRYIFLIYKQPNHIKFEEPIVPNTSADSRPNFNVKAFAEKYKLRDPVAGNFFQAHYDDYVPEVYKQLGV